MPSDVFSIAISGFQSATLRLGASAHNLANLNTEDFRPLRTEQVALESGGSAAVNTQSPEPEEVDIAHEFVEQIRARFQAEASLGVLSGVLQTHGRLIDLFV
jgi:flagellar hook protein FlgE